MERAMGIELHPTLLSLAVGRRYHPPSIQLGPIGAKRDFVFLRVL